MTSTSTRSNSDSSVAGEAELASNAVLVGEARRRIRRQTAVNDRWTGVFTGGSFLAVVSAWILLAPPRSVPVAAFAACVAAYAFAGSVEFEIGPGCALPTAPFQVVMLFVLPPQLVPVAVLLGLAGAAGVTHVRDAQRRERPILLAASAWQVVGPAAVFAVAHVGRPALSDWPVYVAALLAQFALDGVTSWVRNCFGLGVAFRQLATALRFTFLCDASLAPVGLAAALAVPGSPGALIFLLPPTLLLAMLQADRVEQLDKTVALGVAFSDTSDLARCDALTGIANRLAWEEAMAAHGDSQRSIGVLLADVDGLKAANDTHGHAMGDRLLIAVADALVRALPPDANGVAFRIGGDEFAMLLCDPAPGAIFALASSVEAAIDAVPALDGFVPVNATVGVGFAVRGADLRHAVSEADRRVNTAKVRRGARRE
jgi:diguanylate cyclase (GGDEF)-like protein